MIENDYDKSKLCNEDVQEFIIKAMYQYEPDLIAAMLVISGMSMYKNMFDTEDYEKICKKIYDDRFKIRG